MKMKKLLALILAIVMVLSLVACGGGEDDPVVDNPVDTPDTPDTPDEPATAPQGQAEVKPFKYGFVSWGTADEHGRTLNGALEWAVNAAGGEIVSAQDGFTPEGQVAAVENLISAGCNMISFCTYVGESVVPTISDLCRENGVYWTMWDTGISDPEIAAYIAEDPFFVGTTAEDNVVSGYNTMKVLGEKGAKNVIIVRYGSGIPTCDERCDGAMQYINEVGNINVVDDVIIAAVDDYKTTITNILIAHPETDAGFMAGGGTSSTTVAEAFKEQGIETFYIGAFDYFDAMGDMLKSGELCAINGGHMITSTFSALLAINAYFGTPLADEPVKITIPYLTLTSYEDYEAYIENASNGAAYTADEMKQYLVAYNPDLTLDSFQEGVSKWSVADIIARKGG